jgi:hypothetical protein
MSSREPSTAKGASLAGLEPNLSSLTEAITTSVLRAVASREEFRQNLGRGDGILVWEPIIRCGGRLILAKGQLQNVLNQQQFDVQG